MNYHPQAISNIVEREHEQEEQKNPVSYAFKYLNSPETQRQYPKRLKLLFDHVGLNGGGGGDSSSLEAQGQAFLDKTRENPQWAQEKIIDFIHFHKQRVLRKELAAGTLTNFFVAIKLFCEMNDITTINWKRLSRALPRAKSYSSNDRAPTLEEIRRLVEYPDRRIKPIVYAMASGGFRLGAWDYLRWKHITPITNNEEKNGELLVAAKVLIYAGEPEEYYTFITPEAYTALKDWMEFRALHGEKITGESWVMRNTWRTADIKRWERSGGNSGLATYPKKLRSGAIKKILSRALFEQGIRDAPLPEGVRRYEWKGAHGYRKFYKSRAEQVMKPINVELTMGHALGLSESYYKPTEKEVLNDYLKAVPLLTINYDNDKSALQKQVAELTEKSKEEDYIIKGKLAEKEKEAEESKKRLEELEAKQEILQANAASVLRALMAAEMGAKPQVEIITWNPDKEGSEALFKAAAIARAKNQKREREHQQRHHDLNDRRLVI